MSGPAQGTGDSPPRVLSYIPKDVSRSICQHLDVPSALRLTQTCRALRQCGERRLYSSVNLTASKMDGDTPLEPLSIEESKMRAEAVKRKVQQLLLSLETQPLRRTYITILRIEPSDDRHIRKALLSILSLISNHLTELTILPIRTPQHWDWHDSELGTERFFSQLRAANLSFDRLNRLQYVFTEEAVHAIDTWMLRMPNLTELDLSSADEMFPEVENPIKLPAGSLPHLRRITLHHLNEKDGCTVLSNLIHVAPNAVFLRLRGQWTPAADRPALHAILASSSSKTLVICDDNWEEADYGMAMNFSVFEAVALDLEEAAVECVGWYEWNELALQLCVPAIPTLQRLSILTITRPPLSDYAYLPLGPTPLEIYHIDPSFLQSFRNAPLLSSILFLYLETPFPPPYTSSFAEPAYFAPSTTWVETGHRGMILREYKPPSGAEKAVFFHLRTLSRAVPGGLGSHLGLRRCFRDWTSYKGQAVPRHVLDAVYKAAGLSAESVEGGRNLQLGGGDRAWKILEEWRETVAGDVVPSVEEDMVTNDEDKAADDDGMAADEVNMVGSESEMELSVTETSSESEDDAMDAIVIEE